MTSAGRVVWYSASMLGVCRLVRVGDEGAAAAVYVAAERMASHRAARFVDEGLAERGGPDPDPTVLDADAGGALTRLAILTASARLDLGPALGVESFAGRVRETSDKMALVVSDDGNVVSIPSHRPGETASPPLARVDPSLLPLKRRRCRAPQAVRMLNRACVRVRARGVDPDLRLGLAERHAESGLPAPPTRAPRRRPSTPSAARSSRSIRAAFAGFASTVEDTSVSKASMRETAVVRYHERMLSEIPDRISIDPSRLSAAV